MQYKKNFKIAVPGAQTLFKIEMRNPHTGELIDDDGFLLTQTLPRARVFNEVGALLFDTNVDGHSYPLVSPHTFMNRVEKGVYEFMYKLPTGQTITFEDAAKNFELVWSVSFNSSIIDLTEKFDTAPSIAHSFRDERRIGFAFNNPDLVSSYYYPGFGKIYTAQEARYILFFGNNIAAANGDFFTEDVLQWYIDSAIAMIENDLDVKLTPKVYRHTPFPFINQTTGLPNVRTDVDLSKEVYEFEDPYDFDMQAVRKFMYVKLRQQPIITVMKAQMVDINGGLVLDLIKSVKPNLESGSLEFYPTTSQLANLPYLNQALPFSVGNGSQTRFPDGFLIDYVAGYERADKVPVELRTLIQAVAGFLVLTDVGDGLAAAIASQSISLAGISESISTTQSATAGFFGSRLMDYQKYIKMFYNRYRHRYGGMRLAGL